MRETIDRRATLGGLAATLVALPHARAQTSGLSPAIPTAPGVPASAATGLRAAPLAAKLAENAAEVADLWCFEGRVAGPVLRIKHGDEVRAELRNDTPNPLTLHWHGVRGVAAMDGVGTVSQPPVGPGETFTYRFTPPDAGTFLVRPMNPGHAGEHAGRGLAAMLIVEERAAPEVAGDYACLVRDWRLEPSGALAPFGRVEEAALAGRLGNLMFAGGSAAPQRIRLPGGTRIRLRLANGCNARIMRIRFDGVKAYVAAVDGQPTDTFEPLRSTLPFAPGSRYDLFLDMPAGASGKAAVVALVGPGLPLVTFEAEPGPPAAERPVAALAPNRLLPPEIRLQNAVRANVVIVGGASRTEAGQVKFEGDPKRIWTVNGAPGSITSPPLFTARRGQPVVLAITNRTGFVQPMHLHGHMFRLLHAADDGWEPYWLDTLQVADNRTVHIAFLADNPGRWALSSTVLERFDTGLWAWFEVT